jgi:glutathione-regulated potassium-efflux system ancillary protein KefF
VRSHVPVPEPSSTQTRVLGRDLMVVVIAAHPYPDKSRANRALTRAIGGVAGVELRSLYDLYPDYAIDVAAEQAALVRASTVVWQHPIYWYAPPALLKLWFEKVLLVGWAYGDGGTALHGKSCLWVATTGADTQGYQPEGAHRFPFQAFVPVIQQTAQFCGMTWLDPIVVHGAHRVPLEELDALAGRYRARLEALVAEEARRAG